METFDRIFPKTSEAVLSELPRAFGRSDVGPKSMNTRILYCYNIDIQRSFSRNNPGILNIAHIENRRVNLPISFHKDGNSTSPISFAITSSHASDTVEVTKTRDVIALHSVYSKPGYNYNHSIQVREFME